MIFISDSVKIYIVSSQLLKSDSDAVKLFLNNYLNLSWTTIFNEIETHRQGDFKHKPI